VHPVNLQPRCPLGIALPRIDFVKGVKSGGRNARLDEVSWDEWFRIFDDNSLVFLYQPEGESKFFKLLSADTARENESRSRGRRGRSSRAGRRGVSTGRRESARTARRRTGSSRRSSSRGRGRVTRRKVRQGARTVMMECREI
jgi:hypothetical protein